MSSSFFYKRTYSLTITDELSGWSRTYTELDIKFQIKRAITQTAFQSTISILGLSVEDINRLTVTATSMFSDAMRMRKKVELSAGYNGDNTLIYRGYIVSATVTSPPEMWLTMTAVNYYDVGDELGDHYIVKGTKLVDVIDYFANVMDMVPNTSKFSKGDLKINGFSTTGGKSNIIRDLNALYNGWVVYEDLGNLIATDLKYNKMDDQEEEAVELDRNNGLLAISNVTFYGVQVTTFLQDIPLFASRFRLTSELMPSANGIYRIKEREFIGHYRGNEWFSKFTGVIKESL